MNCGATAASNTLRRSVSAARSGQWVRRRCRRLIWHECLALIVPRRLCRWGDVVRRFRFGGLRLGSGLRGGVILRRRRDDDQRGRKILAGGGKRRNESDQRKPRGKSNGVGLQGRAL